MKGGMLLALYLVRDTLSRWVEQPAGVIAKGSVVGFMVATATAILASFALAADELERRLSQIGLDRFFVRETTIASTARPGAPTIAELIEASSAFGEGARTLTLLVSPLRAKTELGSTVPVFVYDADEPPMEIAAASVGDAPDSAGAGAVLFAPDVPGGVPIEVRVSSPIYGDLSATVRTATLPAWSIGVDPNGMVVVPVGHGLVDTRSLVGELTIVERGPDGPPLETLTAAVNRLARAERIDVTVRSPGPILRSLEDLRSRRDLVRGAIAVVFGAGAAFVFAAMGVLEYREVRFVGALLRSFGAATWSLFARHAIEQVLIANAGMASALALMWFTRVPAVEALGYPVGNNQAGDLASIVAPEIVVIASIMNGGVIVGLLPVAWLVAKPVGRVLS